MKRRAATTTVDGKYRRPVRRNHKMPENLYGGSVVYVKLLLLWFLVIFSDYFFEFRFEYLWPFWLFLRSVYDSFKYQGLAFSVFFICIAITSDMICFLFIPVHWLFFAASTYVWVQYVWHTEKGVCVPTVALWLIFVYVEAAIRLREFKAHLDMRSLPFHLDLCRPFAAHCIGYPVVTLGFGFKSYVGYRMRQRKQREVQKENEYYFEFLREALPPGPVREEAFNPHPSPKPCSDDRLSESNGLVPPMNNTSSVLPWGFSHDNKKDSGDLIDPTSPGATASISSKAMMSSSSASSSSNKAKYSNGVPSSVGDVDCVENDASHNLNHVGNSATSEDVSKGKSKAITVVGNNNNVSKKNKESSKFTKDDVVVKLEQDIKRLRADLQQSRNKENDLRDQIISYMSGERHLKSEISNLQVEKSVLESRLSVLLQTRATEKAAITSLEKKLAEERKQKTDFQIKLETERKSKKEAANAERTVRENQNRSEVLKLEAEIKTLRSELQVSRERCHQAETEAFNMRKYTETHGDPEVLVKALKAMQETNNQKEQLLSAETKLKMDLFSALGEAKRELSIKQALMMKKDKEIGELKAKIAEVLAVMPHSAAAAASVSPPQSASPAPAGISSFAPTTLALDLPPATDLSFTGKLSGITLASEFDPDAVGGIKKNKNNSGSSNSSGGNNASKNSNASNLYSFNAGNSIFSPQTNGKINDA